MLATWRGTMSVPMALADAARTNAPPKAAATHRAAVGTTMRLDLPRRGGPAASRLTRSVRRQAGEPLPRPSPGRVQGLLAAGRFCRRPGAAIVGWWRAWYLTGWCT